MSLLDIKDLSVSYGGIRAVDGINLHIEQGELVTLIGANGAGKTTTLKSIVGWVKAQSGSIEYDGKNIGKTETHRFVEQGLVLVPEGRGIFPRLTVLENLEMGAFYRKDTSAVSGDIERVYQLFPRLKERARQLAGTLSGGEQQMLAIGRAMISRPKLLLLDEPSMGLAPIIVAQIFEIIRTISQEGVTILLVEQNAKIALEHADRGYVLESGKITMHGDAQTLLHDERVLSAYLGG
ncbi:MAG: ABC transporter ATP-binding protein [Neisseria sp.]|nr:ABC transporter ATP-binding protein [Neisseria sp.]